MRYGGKGLSEREAGCGAVVGRWGGGKLAKCVVGGGCRARLRVKVGKKKCMRFLYSTCASPVVPHPSTRHAHGCLASEIGRDPAFPTRYDRTELSLEAASLTA